MRPLLLALVLAGALGATASATPAQICVDVNGGRYCTHSPIDPR